ncbi:MAG TPA: cobyric acid synthase [Terriglobia bacterium]|nr:cobyric acid synthase [Terriglobia bacterium]
MSARKIMIQGTGSYVGKSVVTAALCRYFHKQGLKVAPFKAQNMSNNSFVTAQGGEIGRAQAFQAQACGIEPRVEMNPILLKPGSDQGAQVVVLGKVVGVMGAKDYHQFQPQLLRMIQDCLIQLSQEHDILVIEGAGSPAEVNLRPFDIVNMRVARMAAAPVVLVGDINLGGVFAWLVGTLELLSEEERSLVKAFIINKFRGDLSLLRDGLDFLEKRTQKKVLGVLPFLKELVIAEEDSIPEAKWKTPPVQDSAKLTVQVVLLPHISNSTDLESVEFESDVALRYLARVPQDGERFPDLLIIPGSKSTMADLSYMRSTGIADYVLRCHKAGTAIAGICGGYQMLGSVLLDPLRVESSTTSMEGLNLLNCTTTFEPRKTTVQVRALSLDHKEEITGYEIHMGTTECEERPLFRVVEECGKATDRLEGAVSTDGSVWGTYVHGVFDNSLWRRRILNELRRRRGWNALPATIGNPMASGMETLASLISNHIDLTTLEQILNGEL